MSSSASHSVSPSMEDVLPIRGIDGNTGEALPIGPAPGLREGSDPYRTEVVRWAALDVPSIMVEEDLTRLREQYRIPSDVELILPGPNERACFPREGCTALHLNAFVSGLRLPLHPMLRRILRAYSLAPTQVSPNGWSQMVGGMYLWFRHSFGMEMPLHVFQTVYQPRKLPRKKGKEEEAGWYYFCPWGSHKPLVTGCPSSIKQWKESWFWVSGNWQRVVDDPEPDLDVPSVYGIASSLPRCELSSGSIDVLRSIYQADIKSRSYSFILNRQRCLVELGLIASQAEMDQGRRPRPTLAKLAKQKPRTLVPGSAEDSSQRKAIEDLSRAGNKDVAGASNVIEVDDAPEVEVPLSRKRKAKPAEAGVSQARGGAIDVDNTVGGVPPLQRTLAVNKSGEVVLEGPSRPSPAPGSGEGGPFDSKRRLRELIGSSGAKIPDDSLQNVPFYPSMGAQAVKYYFTPKVGGIFLTRRGGGCAGGKLGLGDKGINLANEVAAEALEAANIEKRRLLEEAKSREEEVSSLRKELADAEKAKGEAEDGKKEVEAKLANAEADFVANFHNTEAYSNFSDYFARVGQQEVLTALRTDHPDFDVKTLETRFPPPDAEGEEDS
ncbi:Uncharacterized protein Adt_15430 [Abeliophyllum distichum]|uniref:Transposase (putative) gypsy type domain-containing protein n=1 Tax=Abeliophyllum distichum TaxID=126358 RepID=A0ABD1U3B5_9LAMI